MEFDPYYQWLAIPPKDQPPNHYRLLAVELLESNADVIASAADQRMAHIRSFQSGKHSALSQKLLNEISAAKLCLLNPERKADYDRQLREKLVAPRAAVPKASSPVVAQRLQDLTFLPPPAGSTPPASVPGATPPAEPGRLSYHQPLWIAGGLVVTAVVALLAVLMLSGPHGNEVASRQEPLPTTLPPDEQKAISPKPDDRSEEPARRAERHGGPHDDLPQEAPKPKPTADSTRPADANPTKTTPEPASPPPSSAGPAGTQPGREPNEVFHESQGQPSKVVVPAVDPGTGEAGCRITRQGRKRRRAERHIPKEKTSAAAPKSRPHNPVAAAWSNKKVVPAEADRKAALAVIRDTYKQEYRAADKSGLAKKLLQTADESKSDPARRYTLLQEAARVAADTGQGQLAFAAVDVTTAEFQVVASSLKAQVIEQVVKKVRLPQEQQTVAEAALHLMDESLAEDNFDVAKRMGRQALQMAKLLKDNELAQDIIAKNNEVETEAKAYTHVPEAMAALKLDPQDPEASLTVGRYLCFDKGDWTKGLSLLAAGNDAALKALAQSDLQGAATAEEQMKLGDAWSKVAKPRAVYWYTKAEAGADSQLLKVSLEKRIREATIKTRWVKIFRSADPSLWNADTSRGGLAKVPDNIKYLKMQTGPKFAVIIEMTNDRLFKE